MLETLSQRIPEPVKLAFSISRFALVHAICALAIVTGVSTTAIILCVALYALRMFAVTGGYHRYFSHRTYKTSRAFQFILAVLAQSSGQKGVLWWASHHRHHHKFSDQDNDTHSPKRGFIWAHVGWILVKETRETIHKNVRDLSKFPELVWLNNNPYTPAILLGFICFLIGGWSGVIVGFFWSTVLVYHSTFTINSLSHMWGTRRFATTDTSRNNPFLALITFGEGWHNNHHHYQGAANQGFYWWEIDITFYILVVLEKLGIIWDMRRAPEHIKIPTIGQEPEDEMPDAMPDGLAEGA